MKEILTETRELLSDESRWACGATALDQNCHRVRPTEEQAAAWCLVGAVAKCSNDEGICPPALLRYLDHIVVEYTDGLFDGAEKFNDVIDHDGLLKLLDLAISRAS